MELLRRATQLQLASETGAVDVAASIETEFGPVAEGRESVHAHWFNLARAGYMLREGRIAEAHRLSEVVLQRVNGSSDRDLLDRTRLVVAEAFARSARPTEASNLLETVALGPLGRVAELVAGTERVLGYLGQDDSARVEHFARAARTLGWIGHISGQKQALREMCLAGVSVEEPLPIGGFVGPLVDAQTFSSVNSALRNVAALVDLGASPALAGIEVLELVARSGIATKAAVLRGGNSHRKSFAWTGLEDFCREDRDVVTIPLGDELGIPYELAVVPANDTSARITLLALQRLVASTRALHAAQLAESERSAHLA